ncbi:MAG: hypothetical protein GQ525_04765, partial [Draconibacterium sp.]|nr:hypothetical protein [Draconibacterium sp.]
GATTLNNTLTVTNGSNTHLTGDLQVDGGIIFGDDLTVNGFTTLNKDLLVKNGSATDLTGILNVDGATKLNNNLEVTNGSATNLTGTLNVDGITTINESLTVTNGSNTHLTGDLQVDGGIIFGDDLTVNGFTTLNKNLLVKNGSATDLTGTLNVDGITTINESLTVTNGSNTHLTGDLKADGGIDVAGGFIIGDDLTVNGFTTLNKDLLIENGSATKLTGTFDVDGITKLNNSLYVDGVTVLDNTLRVEDNAHFAEDLNVDGYFSVKNNKFTVDNSTGDTDIAGDLDIAGNLEMNNLTVKGTGATSGEYVAVFENVSDGDGDGIKIKLGKARANNGLGALNPDNIISAAKREKIKGLLDCNKTANDKGILLGQIVAEGVAQDLSIIIGLAAGVGNMVTGYINTSLSLPYYFPKVEFPRTQVFPGFDWSYDFPLKIGTVGFGIGAKYVGPITIKDRFKLIPQIPQITSLDPFEALIENIGDGIGLPIPEGSFNLELIDPTDLSFWGIPNICFEEKVNNPLNNENEFIRFSDSSDKRMGAIRAESVTDWNNNYLFNPIFLYKVYGAITSSTVDKYHAKFHLKGKLFEMADAYYKLGVEYSSGNGDYAEWLERVNPEEIINAGDIVGVTGGKITKNLTNAEQVMAVSTRPIVLGNTPPEGETHLGNNIAFMGQIPVKIMGTVSTGDYIVAKGEIAGYGIAVSSDNMTLEDFKFAVGRAWEDNADKGPKMVNTVIGVHNGDYLNILKRYEQKFRESESRMEAVEAKIDILTGLISEKHKIN